MIPSGQAHLPNSASQWGRFLRRRRCFPHSFSRSSHPKKSGMDAPPHSALRPERAKWKGETPLCFGHLSGNTMKMHLFMLKVGQQQKKGLALWFLEPPLWISIAALHYDSIDTATLDLLAKLNFNVNQSNYWCHFWSEKCSMPFFGWHWVPLQTNICQISWWYFSFCQTIILFDSQSSLQIVHKTSTNILCLERKLVTLYVYFWLASLQNHY